MKHLFYLILFFGILYGCQQPTVQPINIIPQPQSVQTSEGSINWSDINAISASNKYSEVVITFLEELKGMNIHIPVISPQKKEKNSINIISSGKIAKEGYELIITPKVITIKTSSTSGCYYAFQSLKQLLPFGGGSNILLPALHIIDNPRFSYRGMHIDVSRHFFTAEEIKQFIDVIAQYKINRLHIHLTDDQGWRLEIDKYPLLTKKGAWREHNDQDKSCIKRAEEDPTCKIPEDRYKVINGKKMYGGFYTKEQMRDIIKYASEKQITIIPEIDIPGHFMAAIENYPFLSCKGEAGWGNIFSTPACLGKKTTYTFIENILSEVADLFPGEYIHIGGDEVNINSWKECPKCQGVIKKEHLKNEHELQTYFNKHIEKFLKSKGKKLMGWDEIAEGGLTKNATMMWWRNWAPKTREIAATNGNDMIITPDFEYYFDFSYKSTPTSKVYNYEPLPESFTPEMAKHIIGVQANLWSERIPNTKRLYYQALPRMLALAETGWTTKSKKDIDTFNKKIIEQLDRFDAQNLFYHLPTLQGIEEEVVFTDTATLNINIPLDDMKVYYTTNGTEPTEKSTQYTTPVKINKSCIIKIRAYRNSVFSEIYYSKFDKQIPEKPVNTESTTTGITREFYKKRFDSVTQIPDSVKPEKTSIQKEIELGEYSNAEYFGLVFNGFLNATKDGAYTFYTLSDDGDQLFIHDKLVVDNKGGHAARWKKGTIYLMKGLHPVKLHYCQLAGGSKLEVWIKPPGEEKRITTGDDWRTVAVNNEQ